MRTGPLVLAAAVLLALAGCVPTTPAETAAPSPSATPVFASDAEALAAAKAAYAEYLRVSDQIANDGGADPQRLTSVATGQLLSDDLAGYKEFTSKGWRSTGGSRVTGFALESVDFSSDSGDSIVLAYVCEDFSDVDVLDSSGSSVVSDSRPTVQNFEVAFDVVGEHLIPSDRQVWSGSDPCG